MPIVTVSEVQTFLQITGNDALIKSLIPIIENKIVNHCNNEFIGQYEGLNGLTPIVYNYSSTIYFQNSDNSLNDDIEDFTTMNFKANDNIRVYNTLHNDRTFTIDSIAAHKIILNNINTVKDENSGNTIVFARVDYPDELKLTAAMMVKFRMQKHGIMFKSEKIDDYSYTRDDQLINGYPASIMSDLDNYCSLYKKTIPANILYYRNE